MPSAVVLSTILALALLPAKADTFDDAFPAPGWQKSAAGGAVTFGCVSEECGGGSQVSFIVAAPNPKMAENIRSGVVNRPWAEKLAESYRRSQRDKVTLLSFTVDPGTVPSWSMVYECNCNGRTNFISSQMQAQAKGTLIFYSMASDPGTAQMNMNRLIEAALGANKR